MKRFIISAALAAALCGHAVAQQNPDTLLSVNNANKIIITENSSGVEVKVKGLNGDSTFVNNIVVEYAPTVTFTSRARGQHRHRPFPGLRRSKSGGWDFKAGGLMFGFVNTHKGPENLNVEMAKSFELGILQLAAVEYSTPGDWTNFSIGIGLDWRNYKMTTSDSRFIPVDGQVAVGPYPDDVQSKFSRLKIFSLSFPIMIEQKIPFKVPGGSYFSIAFGAVLNYNGHASMKTHWIDANHNQVEEYCGHIGRRPFTVDLMGIVRLSSCLGIYGKYSLMDTLRGDINPSFRTFSTGLILAY